MEFAPVVTTQVLGATLLKSGQLSAAVMTNVVVRAAMLADLALTERLIDTPDALDIDTTPTDFEPIDRLLQAIDAAPNHPLPWWISHAPIRAVDVAQELVHTGQWQRRQVWPRAARYRPSVVLGREGFAFALRADTGSVATTVSACLLASAGWLDRTDFVPPGSLADRCAPADWLVGDLCAALAAKRAMVKLSDDVARSQLVISNGGW